MFKHGMKNWVTSLIGLVASAPQFYTAYETGGKGALIGAIATVLLGWFAKDSNQTGVAGK